MAHVTGGSKTINVPFSVWNQGITGFTGTIAKGETVTIEGLNFGGGATVAIYDPCDGTGIKAATDPLIGSWTNTPTSPYVGGGRDGGNSSQAADTTTAESGTQAAYIHRWSEVANFSKVFVSYAYKHMPNTYWPDGSATAADSFNGTTSSLKPAWLFYSDGGAVDDNDLVLPTMAGGGIWAAGGNDGVIAMDSNQWGTPAEWWQFGDWIRISTYAALDETAPKVNPSTFWMQFVNPDATTKQYEYERTDIPIIDSDGTYNDFNTVNFNNFARNGTSGVTVDHRIDDIYVAYGDNAAARVELGDNAVYENCTDLAICPASSWSDSSITVTMEVASIISAPNLWLHVTKGDNKTRFSVQVK